MGGRLEKGGRGWGRGWMEWEWVGDDGIGVVNCQLSTSMFWFFVTLSLKTVYVILSPGQTYGTDTDRIKA